MTDFQNIVDEDIRPQDDLFHHVNNKWKQENSIPEDEEEWGNLDILKEETWNSLYTIIEQLLPRDDIPDSDIEQKVRDFYVSGTQSDQYIEETGKETLSELFEVIDDCSEKAELSGVIGRLHMRNIYPLWDVYVDQDEKDSSRYLLRFCQGGLSLPDRDYYDLSSDKMQYFKHELEKHIPTMFQAVGHAEGSESQGKAIYAFESTLARNSKTAAELRDVEANYNKMQLSDLQELAPDIDWNAYFDALGIRPPEYISVDQPEFFKSLNRTINETDLSMLRQYLKWHTLKNVSRYMGQRIYRANFEFFGKTLSGVPEMKPLWKRVIMVVNNHIGEALGKLYIDEHFPPQAKDRMNMMTEDIKAAFAERVQRLDWMEEETKQRALEKLHNIRIEVGYPDDLRQYEELEITPDSYIDNCLNAAIHESKRELSKLGGPVDRGEWSLTPATVNAMFNPNLNKMMFPAAILQPPFFDFNGDDAVNYGGIGVVIGHELTHGFDDQGALFDTNGNLRNWWSKRDKAAFDERTRTAVQQADQYEALEGRYLNGKLTLSENIADIGGAEIAFQALEYALERREHPGKVEGHTPPERFFLNFARIWCSKKREERILRDLLSDSHAPEQFRANNTVRNMDGFYETFEVNEGDELYLKPEDRVRIW